jgi:hypothetical protein
MKMKPVKLSYLLISTAIIAIPAFAIQNFETPVVLRASAILPPELLTGPYHQVDERVVNDGYLNAYTIHSKFGNVQATSTEKLRKYIHEISAVAKLKEMQASEEFAKGMTDKAGDVVKGAGALITDPVGSVSNTISGVGKLFNRAGENLFGGSRSDSEGSRLGGLLGYAKAKRDLGYKLGVDVYSHNKLLQDELDAISGADGTGTLVMSGLLMAVPGGAGTAVSITGGSQLMENVMRDNSPADLRKLNREKLTGMGVNKDVADIFIANGVYTPREQTLLVAAIDSMSNTSGRAEFIKFATLTSNPDTAFFRQRQARMYAAYNANVKPIAEFITIGQISAARTQDGNIVFTVPLDHLLWTQGVASLVGKETQEIALMKEVREKHLLLSGTASKQARQLLEKMGWMVQENADSSIF